VPKREVNREPAYVLVPSERRVRLRNLRPGALFMTGDGCMAVKSEYFLGFSTAGLPECILLDSGEYGWFGEEGRRLGGDMLVRELVLSELRE
jgi:hypothetical protein